MGVIPASHAGINFSIGIGLPVPVPPPVVISRPPPVVVEPAPPVCEPAPVVVAPPAVVIAPGYYYYPHRHGYFYRPGWERVHGYRRY